MFRPRVVVAIAAVTLFVQWPATPASGGQFVHPTLGYTLTYSDSWVCDTESLRYGATGPVFMTFPKETLVEGGVLPEGGARIFVQVSPPHERSNFPKGTDEYAKLLEMARGEGGVDIKTAHEPGGVVRVTFTETWEAGTFKKAWVARRRNGRLFVFMLEYYVDDPKGRSYERDLNAIVSSVSALAPTPGRTPPAPKPH